jgi:hypothetical protein
LIAKLVSGAFQIAIHSHHISDFALANADQLARGAFLSERQNTPCQQTFPTSFPRIVRITNFSSEYLQARKRSRHDDFAQ